MSNFQYILFDLDGTLIDSFEGIKNSFEYTFKKLNIDIKYDIKKFIGPPLEDTFEFLGIKNISRAVEIYRENYMKTGMYECKVFEGIEEVLFQLKKRNKNLIVTTSKLESISIKILKNNNILKYFDFVYGSDKELTRNNKAEIIEYAIKKNNIKNRNEVVIIGDTIFDIIGAKKTNIKSIGVYYGYGKIKDVEKADFYINKPNELLDIIK